MLIGITRKVVERSPKTFLVDGFDIRVIRRGVEHFCIEKEMVPTVNKFLSLVKGKNICASSVFYTVEHTIWDSSGRAVKKGRAGLERKEIVCHRYIVYKRYVLQHTGCPTRYRTRHFFNNFTTNEDIATKFGTDLHIH
jgi:hypothetical protein